jgi:NAD(P)-dependent dehydrogenase (short-subunit alcohol dehydrogenase family)
VREIGGKTAVVIGGGSGVGRGVALGLADAGANVVIADIDPGSAEAVAKEAAARADSARKGAARSEARRALALQVDGTSRESLAALAERAARELGPVHLLSNNVGVMLDRPLDGASEADWAWVIELNLLSIVRAVDVFLPHLRAAPGEKHIVNTASMAALVVSTRPELPVNLGLYTATKHALLGYTETLRAELAPENIGVSVLCPGLVRSNLARTSALHRPARHGGPLAPPAGEMPPELARISMDPLEVGPIVVRAIRANRLHILTHPDRRAQVEARQQRLLADFDFAAGDD